MTEQTLSQAQEKAVCQIKRKFEKSIRHSAEIHAALIRAEELIAIADAEPTWISVYSKCIAFCDTNDKIDRIVSNNMRSTLDLMGVTY
jgi:hypothetical protein